MVYLTEGGWWFSLSSLVSIEILLKVVLSTHSPNLQTVRKILNSDWVNVCLFFQEICTLYLAASFNHDKMNFINGLGLVACLAGISLHVILKAVYSKYSITVFFTRFIEWLGTGILLTCQTVNISLIFINAFIWVYQL